MNRRECAIVSAYTGFLCGEFSDMDEYIEEIMGRPVLTYELCDKDVAAEIKARAKTDFVGLGKAKAGDDE